MQRRLHLWAILWTGEHYLSRLKDAHSTYSCLRSEVCGDLDQWEWKGRMDYRSDIFPIFGYWSSRGGLLVQVSNHVSRVKTIGCFVKTYRSLRTWSTKISSVPLWDSLPFVDNRPLNLRWDAMLLRPRGRWIRTKYWRWRRFFDERPTLDVVVASGLRSSGRTSGIRNRNDMENGVILHKNLFSLLISASSRCSNQSALNYCLVVSKIYNLVI